MKKRLVSEAAFSETIPVVKAKQSEVYLWGGGRTVPQKLEIFKEGKGALQVGLNLSKLVLLPGFQKGRDIKAS
jgi:hypothetical protein